MIWLTNPLVNHLFALFVIILLVLLGSAACTLLAVQHVRLVYDGSTLQASRVSQHVLWQRYRTWAIIGVLFGAAVFCGSLVMAALCTFWIMFTVIGRMVGWVLVG
jgi:hypothetical protein